MPLPSSTLPSLLPFPADNGPLGLIQQTRQVLLSSHGQGMSTEQLESWLIKRVCHGARYLRWIEAWASRIRQASNVKTQLICRSLFLQSLNRLVDLCTLARLPHLADACMIFDLDDAGLPSGSAQDIDPVEQEES